MLDLAEVTHAIFTCGFFIAFAIAVATPVLAGYKGYGVGMKSCGAWLQERKPGSSDWFQIGQWVLGYVTAYGYYGTHDLRDVDSRAMSAWIDNYRQQNPLEDIETAAQKLIDTLKTKKR